MSISGLLRASIRLDFAARLRGVYLRFAPARSEVVYVPAGTTLAVECLRGPDKTTRVSEFMYR